MLPATNPPQIWAVASGKGGVGKSFVTANLGMAIAANQKRVVIVDLDLGSANMHTCLGRPNPKSTLSQLFTQNNPDINHLIEYDSNSNIGLISGVADNLQMANLKHFQKLKIMRNLSHIDADIVILDLGAGTSFNTIDFFIEADKALLTVIPEPTSIENSYRFIKCMLARKLKDLPQKTKKIINDVLILHKNKEGKPQSFATLMADMEDKFPKHEKMIRDALQELNLNLIVNQVIETPDTKLGVSMAIIFRKYFDVDLNILGYLFYDIHVVHSLKGKKSYYQHFPQSRNVTSFNRIALQIISDMEQKVVP